MVSRSRCCGFTFVFVDVEATASFSAAAIVSFMDCSSLHGFFDLVDVGFQLLDAFLWVVIALIPIDRLRTRG
jgi:hypothetical protein